MTDEIGSDARLPQTAQQHMADQLAAAERAQAAEQAAVDAEPDTPEEDA